LSGAEPFEHSYANIVEGRKMSEKAMIAGASISEAETNLAARR
jgi:hypothetical protein